MAGSGLSALGKKGHKAVVGGHVPPIHQLRVGCRTAVAPTQVILS